MDDNIFMLGDVRGIINYLTPGRSAFLSVGSRVRRWVRGWIISVGGMPAVTED